MGETEVLNILENTFNFNKVYQDSKRRTEICRSVLQPFKSCKFSECLFAHSISELRPRVYDKGAFKKTKCLKYDGVCGYGRRCLYCHDEKIYEISPSVKLMFSETERLFRIVHDQGDGTVATYALESDANYQEDSSKKFIESLWVYISDQHRLKIANLNTHRNLKKKKAKKLAKKESDNEEQDPDLSPARSSISSPEAYTYTRESTPESYYMDTINVVDDYSARKSYDGYTFDDEYGLDNNISGQILVELFQLRNKLARSENDNIKLRKKNQHLRSIVYKNALHSSQEEIAVACLDGRLSKSFDRVAEVGILPEPLFADENLHRRSSSLQPQEYKHSRYFRRS